MGAELEEPLDLPEETLFSLSKFLNEKDSNETDSILKGLFST